MNTANKNINRHVAKSCSYNQTSLSYCCHGFEVEGVTLNALELYVCKAISRLDQPECIS